MASRMRSDFGAHDMQLTLDQKVGQLFFPAAFINDSDENIKSLEHLIKTYSIGGLTFFHSRQMAATNYEKKKDIPVNAKSYERLKELIQHYQSISNYPLLISIDAEWGLAMRVENTEQYPYALTLGALSDPYLAYQVGEAIGKDLLDTGIHLNLAPVLDINENPANPVIGYRSFGEDKNKVASLATAYYRGMKSVGVLGCAKHFPGHGNTAIDSHLSLPIIDKSENDLMDQELYPFLKAIEKDIDLVMPGHLAIPALSGSVHEPASLSGEIIKGLLRKKLKFKGAIMTDALNMHAVSKMFELPGQLELVAFNAGNDILSFSSRIPEAIELICTEGDANRIDESCERIVELKKKADLFEEIGKEQPQPLTREEAIDLRLKLAEETISEVKVGSAIAELGLDTIACLIINKSSEESVFASEVSQLKRMPIYDLPLFSVSLAKTIENSLAQYDRLIVGLYVPNIKPQNEFGLNRELIKWLAACTSKHTIQLVVFGNPYALEFINYAKTERTIIAYQSMNEFEMKAAQALFGEIEIKGMLPITINTYE